MPVLLIQGWEKHKRGWTCATLGQQNIYVLEWKWVASEGAAASHSDRLGAWSECKVCWIFMKILVKMQKTKFKSIKKQILRVTNGRNAWKLFIQSESGRSSSWLSEQQAVRKYLLLSCCTLMKTVIPWFPHCCYYCYDPFLKKQFPRNLEQYECN